MNVSPLHIKKAVAMAEYLDEAPPEPIVTVEGEDAC
jgi:hypothetical protein